MSQLQIGPIDCVTLVVYLLGIVSIGCWAGYKQRKSSKGRDYFLAGGKLTWPIIGLSLFAVNISTVHLVSLAQEGYANGLAYGNFEWMAAFTLVILALFFAPFYVRSKVTTLPDFLEKRYSKASRNWLAFISIVSAIFIHIGFSLYAGAVVMRGLFGIDIMVSIVVVAVLTGLYTAIGGLLAVVLTESIQSIVLLIGAICITAMGFTKIGGWEGLTEAVDPVYLTILRPKGDASGLPWYSVFLGYPIIGIWYWCTDQTIVQHVLGAKDENHARVGPLFAGFIKILPVFIFVLPGTICLGLINKGVLPELADSADTYSFLIAHLLPVGMKGLIAAALLAALMSTVAGALNSVSTLFCYDLYKQWKPDVSDKKLVVMGRIVIIVGMLIAIGWSPLVGKFPTVFQGISEVISYLSPPITVVFLAGVFWKKATKHAAFYTLVVGAALGLTVFFLSWFKDTTGWNVPFMMAGFYLAVICAVMVAVISLMKPEPLTESQKEVVWHDIGDAFRGEAWPGIGNYKILSVVLVVVMVILYTIFR